VRPGFLNLVYSLEGKGGRKFRRDAMSVSVTAGVQEEVVQMEIEDAPKNSHRYPTKFEVMRAISCGMRTAFPFQNLATWTKCVFPHETDV